MAANGIVGKGRHFRLNIHDFAVGYQPKLDQGLEAVADSKH